MPIEDFQVLIKTHAPADRQEALLKEASEVFDHASALPKVKEANADLTRQRGEWETKEKGYKDTLSGLEGQKKDLETRLKSAMEGKVDLAEVNAIREELKTVKEGIAKSEAEKAQAILEKAETDLKNSVISAATSANDPGKVFILMKAEGRVGFRDGKPFFIKFNAEGQPVALKVEDAVEAYLAENEYLRKASGSKGSGTKPTQPPPGGAFNARDHL